MLIFLTFSSVTKALVNAILKSEILFGSAIFSTPSLSSLIFARVA